MADNPASVEENTNSVILSGKTASGKSASLMHLPKPEGVLYLNCENKRLPFRSKFVEKAIIDPKQVIQGFEWSEKRPEIHTVVVDTITFMMDMYESMYVINSANTMKALILRAA